MRIYEDHNNPGLGFDAGIEAYDFFELRLTVGEKKFSIGSPVTFAASDSYKRRQSAILGAG